MFWKNKSQYYQQQSEGFPDHNKRIRQQFNMVNNIGLHLYWIWNNYEKGYTFSVFRNNTPFPSKPASLLSHRLIVTLYDQNSKKTNNAFLYYLKHQRSQREYSRMWEERATQHRCTHTHSLSLSSLSHAPPCWLSPLPLCQAALST